MRIGIALTPPTGGENVLGGFLERFRAAEDAGFKAAWISGALGYEVLTLLAVAGRVTRSIELGSFVVPTYPRHPAMLAQQALTVQAATGNRLTLGIGLSHRVVIEDRLGLDYSKPIRHMREYLAVLDGLFSGQPVSFRGREYRVSMQLSLPEATRPPVLVAALGPQMLRLAGAMADGTAVWMGGARYLEQRAVPLITQAAREAGRAAPRIVAGLPVSVTKAVESARASAARSFAMYGQLPSYRAAMDVEGAAGPEDVAIIGDEAAVARQLEHLAEVGVTDFDASPFSVADDREARDRTQRFLAELARSGG